MHDRTVKPTLPTIHLGMICQALFERPQIRALISRDYAFDRGKAIVRAADGALAWRCSLQAGTPLARRLHWGSLPGESGVTAEFANVAVHDKFSIPE
jgi:hypothetical protein